MPELPTGVVTFLFTDIEGSTRLWREHPRRMSEAVERHDVILTRAIEAHGGVVVKSRLEGDSFFAVFDLATEAVAAACAMQRDLAAEPWPEGVEINVRAALNTGEAFLRGDDYFGPAVNMCARMRSVAHGGQVLLSTATHVLVQDSLPQGVSTTSLGAHRLRDMGHARELFQLDCPGLRREFPALRTFGSHPNNLPLQLTSFVGREQEVATVRDLLSRHRLVTLTGPGGCGKTRLALQTVASVLEDFPDGAWMVDLSDVSDPTLVQHELASVLGMGHRPGVDLTEGLCDHLAAKTAIVVLDNCERVIGGCAALAVSILTHCTGVRILTTSRERLNVEGEMLWVVPPLPVPPDGADAATVGEYSSVQLFLDRALARWPTLEMTESGAGALVWLCRHLEGMPLAIELAAALVGTLSLEQIAERLADRLDLLSNGPRSAAAHHRSLRATIDWSYELLAPDERALFRSLSVFAGFDLAAVEAVCWPADGDDVHAVEGGTDALEVLSRLIDKSLVVVGSQIEGSVRYRLLETLREYARERLLAEDEEREVRRQHARHYLRLAAAAEAGLATSSEKESLDALALEHDNIRIALAWCIERRQPRWALAACEALCRYWFVRGHIAEGRHWLDKLVAMPEAQEPLALRAVALKGAGTMASRQGDLEAAALRYDQSLECFRRVDDRRGVAMLLNNLGNVARQQGEFERARGLYEQSLEIKRELGERTLVAATLRNLGGLAATQGRYESARRHVSAALAIDEAESNPAGVAVSHVTLGALALNQGATRLARSHLQQSLTMCRALENDSGVAVAMGYLGQVDYIDGHRAHACRRLEESLRIASGHDRVFERVQALDTLGDILLDEGDPAAACECFRRALSIRLETNASGEVVHSVEHLARLACVAKRPRLALRLASAAERLRQEYGIQAPPIERDYIERTVTETENQLDRDEARRVQNAGEALSAQQAIDLATETAREILELATGG